jgi:flagellar hook-associated protein 3 FlgL
VSLRVNPNTVPDLLSQIQATRQQEDTATLQLATGSRINRPSDDPAGAAQMVSNRDATTQADSFLRSVNAVSGLLQTTDSTLSSVVTVLQRGISLGVEGASGTLSDPDRAAIAGELTSIRQQMMSLANTSYQGEFIFSGTANVQPFVADATSPSAVAYQGNSGTNSVAVSQGYSLQVNLPGSQLFTTPGADPFQALTDVINALQANSGIGDAVTELNSAYSHITEQRVFFGNAMNQLQSQQNYLNSEKVNLGTAQARFPGQTSQRRRRSCPRPSWH